MSNIVVLEDDSFVRTILYETLNRNGYTVSTCDTWETLQSKEVELKEADLLLLDIQLPDANGIDILREIKSNLEYAALSVVMITGDTNDHTLETCLMNGAIDYIVKPFEEVKLRARVKAAVERSRKFKKLEEDIYTFKEESKNVLTKNNEYKERIHNLEMLHEELSSTTQHLAVATWRERQQKEQLNSTLAELNDTLEALRKSREEVEASKKKIVDSINYAKKIQRAYLPDHEKMQGIFPNAFVFYAPRDIVSGDFYWSRQVGEYKIMGAFDCTGHGVPGAMMSMIGMSLLNEIVRFREVVRPDKILAKLHDSIYELLHQHRAENKDGMDAAVICLDMKKKLVQFSGAANPLVYFKDDECHVIKGTRLSVGGQRRKQDVDFELHEMPVAGLQELYLFSDGFQDQFGGEESKKMGTRKLLDLFTRIHHKPMEEQHHAMEGFLEEWMLHGKSPQKQIDDILVIGLRLEE